MTDLHPLSVSFPDLLRGLLDGTLPEHAGWAGLADFSPQQLVRRGYELAGDPQDVHLYEQSVSLACRRRSLPLLCKVYYNGSEPMGVGFSVGKGLRLNTLLKQYQALRGLDDLARGPLELFFFDEERRDGAVILEGTTVVRFDQGCSRSAYRVVTLERDPPASCGLPVIATATVRHTMHHYPLPQGAESPGQRPENRALTRLLKGRPA
ncbi:hypothetical protein BK634_15645 [Pseudomonas chlororaphis]|nr:hypothetical protein BK634_15645 [Pseudomonas chlororaphis]